jgi:hypothetical protein
LKKNVVIKAAALLFAAVFVFTGCSVPTVRVLEPDEPGPEVGCWSGEYRLNEIDRNSLSSIGKKILSKVAGDTTFEVEMEFTEDGYFYYDVNMDKLKESLSGPIGSVVGFFVHVDVSEMVESLLEAAFHDAVDSCRESFSGTYTADGSKLICDCGDRELCFRIQGGRIIQLNEDGTDFLVFKAVS